MSFGYRLMNDFFIYISFFVYFKFILFTLKGKKIVKILFSQKCS